MTADTSIRPDSGGAFGGGESCGRHVTGQRGHPSGELADAWPLRDLAAQKGRSGAQDTPDGAKGASSGCALAGALALACLRAAVAANPGAPRPDRARQGACP